MALPLRYHEELTPASLHQLATGELDLIRHRGFVPAGHCEAVLPRVVAECELARYTLTSDLQSLGTSLGEVTASPELTGQYFATAPVTTALIRDRIFGSLTSPLDRLRLWLDEAWPYGAGVARHEQRMMLPGIIRRWPLGGQANPHIDERGIELLAGLQLSRRIGVNVYLEVPPAGCGGEVEFWGRPDNEHDYARQRRPDYGLDRELLGEPHRVVAPELGDLLMFDAARIHGVRKVSQGSRVTAACFVGVRTQADPLVVFA